jgi:hypothetical protein
MEPVRNLLGAVFDGDASQTGTSGCEWRRKLSHHPWKRKPRPT